LRARLAKVVAVSEKAKNNLTYVNEFSRLKLKNLSEAAEKLQMSKEDFEKFLKDGNATEFQRLEYASVLYLLGRTAKDLNLLQKSSEECDGIKERGLSFRVF
jgi:hypothetical protein